MRYQWSAGLILSLAVEIGAPAVTAQNPVVIRSGQASGVPGMVGQQDDTVMVVAQGNAPGIGIDPLLMAPGSAAQGGQRASVVFDPSWLPALSSDPVARWIAMNPAKPPLSVLYGAEFELTDCAPGFAGTLDLSWAVADRLGDPGGGPNPIGAYLNGTPLNPAWSGGSSTAETRFSASIPPGVLQKGPNALYLYKRNTTGNASGIVFSATITRAPCTARVHGVVYDDRNGNGSREPGEPALDGWTVALTDAAGTIRTATMTGGAYQFFVTPDCGSSLAHRIGPVMQPCWARTTLDVDVPLIACTTTTMDFGVIQAWGPDRIEQEVSRRTAQGTATGSRGLAPGLGQEFVAQSTTYAGIDLFLESCMGLGCPPLGPITVQIRAGDINGAIVGTSPPVTPSFPLGSGWAHFPLRFFADLTPGQVYVIEPLGGPEWSWEDDSVQVGLTCQSYPNGVSYYQGNKWPIEDRWFRIWTQGGCCSKWAGDPDDFASRFDPADVIVVRPAFETWLGGATVGFDDQPGGRFGYSFVNLPFVPPAMTPRLTLRLRAAGGGPNWCSQDDILSLQCDTATNTFAWQLPFGNLVPTLLGSSSFSWHAETATITLDLSAAPDGNGGTVDLRPLLNADGYLDVFLQNCTAVDFLELSFCDYPAVGTGCLPASCPTCPMALGTTGTPLTCSATFGPKQNAFALELTNAPSDGLGWFILGAGTCSGSLPLFCGSVLPPNPVAWLVVAAGSLGGSAPGCDGSARLPLPYLPCLSTGVTLCAQAVVTCPTAGFGLSNAIQFEIE